LALLVRPTRTSTWSSTTLARTDTTCARPSAPTVVRYARSPNSAARACSCSNDTATLMPRSYAVMKPWPTVAG